MIIGEVVNYGSFRRGLDLDSAGNPTGHEDNEWTIEPDCVYIPGFINAEDLESLKSLPSKKTITAKNEVSSLIQFPSISIVYFDKTEAVKHIQN
jgi:hypothetical protein